MLCSEAIFALKTKLGEWLCDCIRGHVAEHIRRCKTRIYGKGAEMYKGIYKKVHR